MSPTSQRRRQVAIGALVAVVMATGAGACSSDDSPAAERPSTTVAETDDDATASTTTTDDDTDDDDTDEAALTAEDICEAVPADTVAEATGLEITEATASTSSTPQCAYSFVSENGPDSNLTVAASRYTSSDAQSIEQAFDGAVQINIATAGGTSVEQTEVDAGDEAIILSGTVLDLGVLRVGNVLVSVIVPPGAVTPAQTESLMVAIGDGFA